MNTAFPQHGTAIDLDRYRRADRWRIRSQARSRARPGAARAAVGTALVATGRRLLEGGETRRPAIGGDPGC
jgi:hypothetical protein